ncbi:chemotaxis protein CheB [Achromobacter arsenitoxydans]|uniref:protein-glutamate methylesterase n=1 Tax=Achromobacter arsenitoxydans SY8 TaxID=477184 RepID=H0FES4_9BURK|nr:chemotaxis protein CheB [Achromobacter arsenitoxydans]EHK63225.1 CheB methylesterase [Achromobacter arsenitoxydans SY8]
MSEPVPDCRVADGPAGPWEAIVIGGSSGAIDALNILLPALPAGLRASVIVLLHVAGDRPSRLADIFGHRCALPVLEAEDQQPLRPGHVYVAPPGYHLLVDQGPRLALSIDPPVLFSRPSIDVLFHSAADCYGERLLGVLLSGANEDGADGLASIHAAGGGAVVQAPSTAAMRAMPDAALARVPESLALSPEDIADLFARLPVQRLPDTRIS